MLTLDNIRKRVKELHETEPHIHVNIQMTGHKSNISNIPVVITGVYPHIFQIEENSSGTPKRHCIQYNDILTNHFEIIEF